MNTEKMKEIFSDEAFVKSLFELDTAAEVHVALKEKGVELTEEDILAIREFFAKVESGEISVEQLEKWVAQAESGELSDELLEQVSGGSLTALGVAALVILGVCGVAILGGMAACVSALIYECSGRHW